MPRLSSTQLSEAIGMSRAVHLSIMSQNHFCVTKACISRPKTIFQAMESTKDRHRSGKPRITTVDVNRHNLTTHLRNFSKGAPETLRAFLTSKICVEIDHLKKIESDRNLFETVCTAHLAVVKYSIERVSWAQGC